MKLSSLLCLLFLLPGVASGQPSDPTLAAWVARDRLTSPASVAEVCRAAREAGIGTLIVQVRGRGDAYYATDLAPRAEALAGAPEGFDPLAEVLKRAQGLRVLAWINVFLVWSDDAPPRDPSHVARARADWVLKDADGRSVSTYGPEQRAQGWIEGIYADPASSGYRDLFARLAAEVAVRYPVDGIHLDFVRYAGPGYGRGGELGEEFRRTWALDPRWLPLEDALPTAGPESVAALSPSERALARAGLAWADRRASQVTETVRAVRQALRQVRPELELSAAVFPDRRTSRLEKGQDWGRWAREGLVDALYPMAYFGGSERVAAQLAEMRRTVDRPGVRLFAGLGAYLKPPDRIGAEAREAWRLGFDGVSLYDVGTLLRRPEGLRPYAQAATAGRGTRMAPPPSVPAAVGGGDRSWAEPLEPADETDAAAGRAIAPLLARLEAGPVDAPAWVDARGIFRFVHPLDGVERRQAQRRAAEAARDRVRAGEEFGSVAAQVSQWSTRTLGGALPRRYLSPSDPADAVLARTEAGAVTDVVEGANGYWVYRVDAKGGGEATALSALPWPARRALLRDEVAREMNPSQSLRAEGGP